MKAGISGISLYLGMGFLFSHELDAMVQAEWRLLYVLRSLPDSSAIPAFISMHVPVFAVVIWIVHHSNERLRLAARRALAAFCVLHAGIHLHLSDSALYSFDSVLSITLVYGAAICGAVFLATSHVGRLRPGA